MQNDKTVYEIGFHLNPTLPEGEVLGKVSDLKQAISTRSGEIISEGFPTLIQLAYTIVKHIGNENKRFHQAYFGWIKFEMESASIVDLKKVLESDIDMIRFLIIKTVREDTMISDKPEFKIALGEDADGVSEGATAPTEAKPKKELTTEEKAEIDKEIDDLVSEKDEQSNK